MAAQGWQAATAADVAVISHQIGRPARGVLAVAARCRFGQPQVAVVQPVLTGGGRQAAEPFPTTFWLTCPYLVAQVGTLESQGWIRRLQQEVDRDPALADGLQGAHQEAAAVRRRLLEAQGPQATGRLSPAAVRRLLEGGVAGIGHPRGVKCLHAHLAHYLATGANPIGERVAGLLAARGVDVTGSESCRCLEVAAEAGVAAPSGRP